MLNISIWLIDRTLSGSTTPGQGGYLSDGIEWVLHIPQSSTITGVSQSDSLVSYTGHSVGVDLIPQKRCSQCILQALVDWAEERWSKYL